MSLSRQQSVCWCSNEHSLDVFLLVLIGDLDILPIRLQINRDRLSESLILGGEGEIQDASDIIVKHPRQIAVEIRIDTFHILEGNLLPQDHLVKRTDEERVQEASVEDGQTDDTANEFEVIEMLRVDARMGIDLKGVVVVSRVLKQTVEGVKHLVREQEEKLSVPSSAHVQNSGR
jgi:hypothetical protein